MGNNSGVRITRNDLMDQFTIYGQNIETALDNAATAAVNDGGAALYEAIQGAVTPTGLARHPDHPGRIDTGALVDSVWDAQFGEAGPGLYRVRNNRAGNVVVDFGFLAAPPYTKFQEGGTATIEGMMALQKAFNVVAIKLFEHLSDQMKQAGQDAQSKRLLSRASKLR